MNFKYFDNVELLFQLDKFQVCSIFNIFTENKPWLPVANTEPGFVLVFYEYMEDPTNLKLINYFWIYFASKQTSFVFCSCSELLQLKFVKKVLCTETQIGQLPRQLQE